MPSPPTIRSPSGRNRPALRVVYGNVPSGGARVSLRRDESADAATQRIVASITAAIAERRLAPGTKLAQQKLADIFRVSRTRVRHALHQLSRERLVQLEPLRGASVAAPSVAEARQVFEARRLVECALVRQLAHTITPAQVSELRQRLGAERAAAARIDTSGRWRALKGFHTLLARQLGNEVMVQLLAELLARSSLVLLMYPAASPRDDLFAGPAAIVDALERHDARAAVRLMQGHLAALQRGLRPDRPRPGLTLVSRQP